MLRYCVLLITVALPFFSLGQTSYKVRNYPSMVPRGITVNAVNRADNSREQQINNLVRKYSAANPSEKPQIRNEVRYLLMQILNEKIAEKEREVASLDEQLRRMQQDPNYRHRQNEIHDLQEALVNVKRTLIYRKRNKDSIVSKRMAQLFGA